MRDTIKKTLHIVIIVILGWLCYQLHITTVGLERLAQIQYRYVQVTQHGTLCNVEHMTDIYNTHNKKNNTHNDSTRSLRIPTTEN